MRRHQRVTLDTAKPLLRAYALGYFVHVSPKLFSFLRTVRRSELGLDQQLAVLRTILVTSTQSNRFPTAAAIIIGGATALPRVVTAILERLLPRWTRPKHAYLHSRLEPYIQALCSFLSAWVAFDLLNRDDAWVRKRAKSRAAVSADAKDLSMSSTRPLSLPSYHPRYAGKTIDFTTFAFCRALDVIVISLWGRTRSRSWHPEQRTPHFASLLPKIMDPAVFATSATVIMWSWFYAPERLPRSYCHWISKAADIDSRLIQALRLARQGDFVYGENTGQGSLLIGLCRDLGLPQEYADPTKTIPIPCELYHCGTGKSCEFHALSRFWRSWKFAMEIYGPLQLLTLMRSATSKSFLNGLQGAAFSSSFLATFVASFYYAVCLARTRLGPRIIPRKIVTPQMWDSGLCVLAGCLACGWSILLEKPSRRQEIAFFVAPRALATILPRVYDRRHQRREQVAFATSVAAVLTAIKLGNGRSVRGVLGRVLGGIMKD